MTETTMEARSPGYPAGLLAQRIARRARSAFEKFLRRAQSSDRLLLIEERIAIGPKKTLLLVNCAGRRFLVATAGDTIAPLVEVQPLELRPPREDSLRSAEISIAKQESGR
jgi:flagellar biogenesis protein FliO